MSVLGHVVASISPASLAHAEGARLLAGKAGVPMLERVAALLGGAQHTARPRVGNRTIVVVAGDHGAGDPGVALGADHPTVVMAHAITGGTAALAQVARASRTPVVLVDAGAVEGAAMPADAIGLGRGPTRNLLREPAMTIVDAKLGLEAGIALAVSFAEQKHELIAVGAIGVGAELASAALLGASMGAAPSGLGDPDAEAAGAAGAALWNRLGRPGDGGTPVRTDDGLEMLAAFGGADTAVLAGLMLGAASMNIPVVLDGYATGAAALVAAAIAPAVVGSLIAAHAGSFTMPRILAHLGLTPLFAVGLGHGEGTGAAMMLPLADQACALSSSAP